MYKSAASSMSIDISNKIIDTSENPLDIFASVKGKEKLSQYVRRIMHEKNLTFKKVVQMSRGMVSDGYISDLIQEKTINPTVGKLQALARGLGVSEDEIFLIARGLSPEERPEFKETPFAHLADKFLSLPPELQKRAESMIEAFDHYLDKLVDLPQPRIKLTLNKGDAESEQVVIIPGMNAGPGANEPGHTIKVYSLDEDARRELLALQASEESPIDIAVVDAERAPDKPLPHASPGQLKEKGKGKRR